MRFLTAGESHGQALTAIIEGLPAGLSITEDYVNKQLWRRQQGYGRGHRMKIEGDRIAFLAGLRGGVSLGSPLAMQIENKDWVNWKDIMAPNPGASLEQRVITCPRPGHADFAGSLKYGHLDLRNVLERASARETAARVAVGAVARRLLEELGIIVFGYVVRIGSVKVETPPDLVQTSGEWQSKNEKRVGVCDSWTKTGLGALAKDPLEHFEAKLKASGFFNFIEGLERSPVFCPDSVAEKLMIEEIDKAKKNGDSLGGIFEVRVYGLPPGLGSYVHWDRRLDGCLARALMSIPAVKGVEIGLGFTGAGIPGSKAHDEIFYAPQAGYYRLTNHAGGLEGGVTNGEPLILRAAVKPIPTLSKPLQSVELLTRRPARAAVERSDICSVPAACVIGEAVVAWELAVACREKFGGDTVTEMQAAVQGYILNCKKLFSDE